MGLTHTGELEEPNSSPPPENGAVVTTANENGSGKVARSKKNEYGMEYVDERVAARIKQVENAEETHKKDAAFLERYNARVKEVCLDISSRDRSAAPL